MGQKLLQKTRNKFLYHTPPENLIPKKHLGEKKKPTVNRRVLFYQQESSLINNQYLVNTNTSISTIKSTTLLKIPRLFWRAKKMHTPLKNIIQPICHNIFWELNQHVSRNVLATVCKKMTTVDFYKNQPQQGLCSNTTQPQTALFADLLSCKGQATPSTPVDSAKFFSILWTLPISQSDKNNNSLVGFFKYQLYENFCKYLFPIHDINKKQNKINDRLKNQYVEYKKLAILYGNLPKRTLSRTMRVAVKGGGEIESKFLSLLERRLDVALKRLLFFPTIYSARKWISQGKIRVNNQVCTCLGYLLQPADLIQIRNGCLPLWRKEWWAHFRIITKDRAALENKPSFTDDASQTKELPLTPMVYSSTGNVMQNNYAYSFSPESKDKKIAHKKRRFLFPPLLMEKWNMWSKLWGSTVSKRSSGTSKGREKHVHQWSQELYTRASLFLPFFQSSVFALYSIPCAGRKSQPGFATSLNFPRQTDFPTTSNSMAATLKPVTHLVQRSSTHHITHGNSKQAFLYRIPTEIIGLLKWLTRKFSSGSMNSGVYGGKKGRLHHPNMPIYQPFMSFLLASLFLRQQAGVVDGCFHHRWNKILTKKKLIVLKRKDWRWSCIKPMHFECSYKCPTAIYLYPPQKFVWPSSINVLLLKTALSC